MKFLTVFYFCFLLLIGTALSTEDATSSPIGSLIAHLKLEHSTIDEEITYNCKTAGNSPIVGDVLRAALILYDRGSGVQCRQYSLTGSKCTKLVTSGNAGIQLCGDVDQWLQCRRVGVASIDFIGTCEGLIDGKWRVGGYMNVSSKRISVVI
ncbi:uncharacterized protein H6S33_005918 [Morchella sextelata]|jgi:hypothetical protein|uniref:uncharacterized protein n=1 Tax=Morchella sextelata TaxID=1174677 RepID=UPI001D05852C|nr:uncharacterized protein H6S33_005918 [Morchella sextelata]KAH0614032.1 hypothetical protein H6S33_005918 [Morchella sextelata]